MVDFKFGTETQHVASAHAIESQLDISEKKLESHCYLLPQNVAAMMMPDPPKPCKFFLTQADGCDSTKCPLRKIRNSADCHRVTRSTFLCGYYRSGYAPKGRSACFKRCKWMHAKIVARHDGLVLEHEDARVDMNQECVYCYEHALQLEVKDGVLMMKPGTVPTFAWDCSCIVHDGCLVSPCIHFGSAGLLTLFRFFSVFLRQTLRTASLLRSSFHLAAAFQNGSER